MWLGYSELFKGYKCLSSTSKIYISRHVVFNEKEIIFANDFLNTKVVSTLILVYLSFFWFPNNMSNIVVSPCMDHQQTSPTISSNPGSSTLDSPRESDKTLTYSKSA